MNDLMLDVPPLPDELKGYPAVFQMPVQWADMDVYGHVNNTVSIRWFESSRVCYILKSDMGALLEAGGWGIVVAEIHCKYRRQIVFPDTVLVGGRVARMRHASMTLEHVIYSTEQQAVAATGTSTVVVYDHQRQRPIRIPSSVRLEAEKLEGRPLEP